jgi:hypothetical protein
MSEYPKFKYHPDGREFICPTQEFFVSLKDHDEFEDEPFTGDRKISSKKAIPCQQCLKLKAEIVELKLKLEAKVGMKKAKTGV